MEVEIASKSFRVSVHFVNEGLVNKVFILDYSYGKKEKIKSLDI